MQQNIDFGTAYYQVTDTTDRAAKVKIHSAIIKHMSARNLAPNFMLYPAYNSIAAGVEVSEIVTNSQRPQNLIVAVNYAPPDKKKGTKDNIRNDFFCAELNDGCVVCGTSNGFEFSYIRPRINKLYRLTNTNHLLSQFRSLEVLPMHAVLFSIPEERKRLIKENKLELVHNIYKIIPCIPDVTHVMEIDNFDNVKIILSGKDKALLEKMADKRAPIYFAFGKAALGIGKNSIKFGKIHKAVAAKTFFAVPMGTNVLATRSSSVLVDREDVPVIASVRARPGETKPSYKKDMPVAVGTPVYLAANKSEKHARPFKTTLSFDS